MDVNAGGVFLSPNSMSGNVVDINGGAAPNLLLCKKNAKKFGG
jgi:hypothetical protein